MEENEDGEKSMGNCGARREAETQKVRLSSYIANTGMIHRYALLDNGRIDTTSYTHTHTHLCIELKK